MTAQHIATQIRGHCAVTRATFTHTHTLPLCVRADVALICFSVVHPRSLRSVYKHWYPEVQRFCHGVPVVVCGCQVDLRYLYNDPVFLGLDKGPFFRYLNLNFCLAFPFSASTLLDGWQEGLPACKKLGVGLLVVTIWLELGTSYSSSCRYHNYIYTVSTKKVTP